MDLPLPSKERYLEVYRYTLLSRTLEDKISALYRAGKIVGGVYTGKGQEALSASLSICLEKGKDVYGPLIRDQAGRLAFGEPMIDMARTYLGSVHGSSRGRDGNVHRGMPREGMTAMISHLGAMISVVAGMLLAKRFQGEKDVVGGTCIGEGGTSTGSFHEAMNMAGIEKLPLVVVVANNQYAYSTPNELQFACHDLVDRAAGYGFEGYNVDGTNLAHCIPVLENAVDRARRGKGPQLIVAKLLRLSGHGEHDDAFYVAEEAKKGAYGGDCIPLSKAFLLEQGWATEKELAQWDKEVAEEVQQVVAQAQQEPQPKVERHTWDALSTTALNESILNQQ